MQGLVGHREEFGFHSRSNVIPLEGFKPDKVFFLNHVKEFGLCSKNNRDPPKI